MHKNMGQTIKKYGQQPTFELSSVFKLTLVNRIFFNEISIEVGHR